MALRQAQGPQNADIQYEKMVNTPVWKLIKIGRAHV